MKTELALYQALVAINVPELKATAVIEALESDLFALLATKGDLAALRTDVLTQTAEIKMQMAQFKSEMAQQETKLLIRMGMMFSASVGILIGAMKLFQ
jgi:hypothetical protein